MSDPTRKCWKCGTDMLGPYEAEIDQSGDTELPAVKFVCPHCGTAVWVATGDPWRPTLSAALPPAKVTA